MTPRREQWDDRHSAIPKHKWPSSSLDPELPCRFQTWKCCTPFYQVSVFTHRLQHTKKEPQELQKTQRKLISPM